MSGNHWGRANRVVPSAIDVGGIEDAQGRRRRAGESIRRPGGPMREWRALAVFAASIIGVGLASAAAHAGVNVWTTNGPPGGR